MRKATIMVARAVGLHERAEELERMTDEEFDDLQDMLEEKHLQHRSDLDGSGPRVNRRLQ